MKLTTITANSFMGKKYKAGVKTKSNPNEVQGLYKKQDLSLQALHRFVQEDRFKNSVVVLGECKHDKGDLVYSTNKNVGSGTTIARTQDHFSDNVELLLVDVDESDTIKHIPDRPTPKTIEEVHKHIITIFGDVDHFILPSSSRRAKGSNSWHAYIPLSEPTTMKRAAHHIHCKLKQMGMLCVGLSSSGAQLPRNFFCDMSVLSPERLIFEAHPQSDQPLLYMDESILYEPGNVLKPSDMYRLDQLIEKPSDHKPDVSTVPEQKKRVAKLPPEHRQRILDGMKSGSVTPEDSLRDSRGEWCLVSDLMDKGKQVSCYSPFEPNYTHPSATYYPDTNIIYDHHLAQKITILDEKATFPSNYDDIVFDVIAGKYVFMKGATVLKHSKTVALDLVDKKTLNSARRVKMMYNPGSSDRFFTDDGDGMDCYNTFRPSKFKTDNPVDEEIPKSVQVLLDHMFIDQDEVKEQFVKALAYHYQTGKAIHLGWIFLGIEGAGKGTLMSLIFKLFGHHNCTNSKLSAFTGDKVKGVENKLIGFIDESIPDNKSEEVVENLKAIISNEEYISRALYVDERMIRNHTMYFFAANYNALKLSEEDRRMNIIECAKRLSDSILDLSSHRKELLSDSTIQSFSNYLLNLKVELSEVIDVVHSDFRTETIEARLTTEELVAKCIITDDLSPIEFMADDSAMFADPAVQSLRNLWDKMEKHSFVSSSDVQQTALAIVKMTYIDPDDFKYHSCRASISKNWGKPKVVSINNVKVRGYSFVDEFPIVTPLSGEKG